MKIENSTKEYSAPKIAFLSSFYPFRGGIAQFNANTLKALSGYTEVNPFTFKRQYPELLFPGTSQFVLENEKVEKINAPRILDSINPISYETSARAILKSKPDLLLLSYWMPFFAPSMGWVAKRLRNKGTKVLSIIHNYDPHEQRIGDSFLNAFYTHQNDGFIALSSHVAERLQKATSKPTLLSPHPVSAHFGDPIQKENARMQLGIPIDQKVVLFFGLIRQYKGLHHLIQAFKNLDASYTLCAMGESYEDFSFYEEYIQQVPHPERLLIKNRYATDEEVRLLFSAADVLVLPYLHATQSGVLAVAQHFELPSIVTPVGGLEEAVLQTGGGFATKSISPEDIHQGIVDFFANDSKTYKFSLQEAKKTYSFDSFALQILEFYQRLKAQATDAL